MRTVRIVAFSLAFAVVVLVVISAVAGCSSTGSGKPSGTHDAAAAQPYNPVLILKLAGVTPDPGEVYGHRGADGDQVAHGMLPGQVDVFVFTYQTLTARDYALAHPVQGPQDGVTTLSGPNASLLTVYATGRVPQQIAARVGGTVVP